MGTDTDAKDICSKIRCQPDAKHGKTGLHEKLGCKLHLRISRTSGHAFLPSEVHLSRSACAVGLQENGPAAMRHRPKDSMSECSSTHARAEDKSMSKHTSQAASWSSVMTPNDVMCLFLSFQACMCMKLCLPQCLERLCQ